MVAGVILKIHGAKLQLFLCIFIINTYNYPRIRLLFDFYVENSIMLESAKLCDKWEQFRLGDSSYMAILYQDHYLGLINYGFQIIPNKDLVNEVITAVFLELWQKRENLPPVYNVRSYLITCLHRKLIAQLQADQKLQHLTQQLHPLEIIQHSHEDYLLQMEDRAAFQKDLQQAMLKLTPRQQELLKLKFYDDLSYDEIALRCQITKRTVYNIINESLKTLKLELKHHNPDLNVLKYIGILLKFAPI
jgi:RNA polymerase sigma factor (sigma-70 family)